MIQMLRDQRSSDFDTPRSTMLVGPVGVRWRLLGGGLVSHQLAQDREEVRHGLTLAGFTTLDTADRDAFVGRGAGLVHQLGKASAAETRRPPHTHHRVDRGLDIVGTEGQCGTADSGLNLGLVPRGSLTLPLTHLRNDTSGCRAEPRPQTPTQRPTGARLS